MKRLVLIIGVLLGATAGPAAAADLCVGGAGCFSTLQAAVTAASDGDTIHVGPGTFAGGVVIDKSVSIVGVSAQASVISGGGPVLTIFREQDSQGLQVSIRKLTITGGDNTSSPDRAVTFGGGISIPVAQLPEPPFNGTGATVWIDESVVTGNTVRSSDVIPPGFCGPEICAFDNGGGIDDGGVLTITNSRITNNVAGSRGPLVSLATDNASGGIRTHFVATLVLRHSVVSGNRAVALPPNGQAAVAGGIGGDGALTIEDSVVSDNSAEITGSAAGDDDQVSLAGGIQIGECCGFEHTASIRNTLIRGNRVLNTMDRPETFAEAFAGGLLAEAPLVLEHALVVDNLVRVSSAGDAAADGGGMEIDSTVTIRDSVVARNAVEVEAHGAALADGGGIANAGDLTLERTLVLANRVSARGAGGLLPFGAPSGAHGGGIWNGTFGGPPPTLTLVDSQVLANGIDAPAGFDVHGGGIFTTFPVSLTRTLVAANRPDQCFGC